MRILKKIILVLVVLVLLAAVIGFFMPRHVHVERSRVMKAPSENVFAQLNNLKNWNYWAPWNRMDPDWKQTWGNVTEGEGANYSWESETDLGKGSMTITKSVPEKTVETELRMEKMSPATGDFQFENLPEGTQVTWSFNADMGSNPFMKLMGSTMMTAMLKKQFDEGLEDLDSVALATPVAKADSIAGQ
jgi:carbon monoxide dehydrogenase subunit G